MRPFHFATAGFVLIGAALRIWQYAADNSLWGDEIALATGILQADALGLLTDPLPFRQVAPKGLLLLQKAIVLALGPSDHALRLVPFVCSLVALPAFAALAARMLSGIGTLIAVLLFATAAPLISYGAIVKQYSVDVCVVVLLSWLVWELATYPVTARRTMLAGLAGATLVWFSQPAVLVLAAFWAVLAATQLLGWPGRIGWRSIGTLAAMWGTSALAVTLSGLASMTPATREYMLRFWSSGFPPAEWVHGFTMLWLWERLMALVGTAQPGDQASMGYPAPAFYVALAAGGLGALWSQNRRACLVVAAPLLVTIAAAFARQYPFSDRLILFLVPPLVLAMAAAAERVHRAILPYSRILAGALTLGIAAPAIYPVMATPPVYLNEHIMPVLAKVRSDHRAGDALYVYYGASPGVAFYAARYGLTRQDYAVGGCHRGNNRRYLEELDTYRGRPRLWVLITHALPRYREREDILGYLDTIATRVDSLTVPSRAVGRAPLPAEVYLYDLSDPEKGRHTSADRFSLTGPSVPDPRTACGDGPNVGGASDFALPANIGLQPTTPDVERVAAEAGR